MPVLHLGHGIHLRRRGVGLELLSMKVPLPLKIRSADIPGTTLRFEDRLFETLTLEESPQGTLWQLQPWEEHRVVRQVFDLSDIVAWAEDRKETESDAAVSRRLRLILPLLGLLPAVVQHRLHRRYNHNPSLATWVSAVFEIFFGFAGIIDILNGHKLLPTPMWFSLVLAILAFEGMIRLPQGFTGQTIGSILTLPLAIREGLEGQPKAESESWEPEKVFCDDEAGAMELASPITRSDWNAGEVLEYEQRPWRCIGWRMASSGSIYRFELAPGAEPTVSLAAPTRVERHRSGSFRESARDGVMFLWMLFAPAAQVRPWAESQGLPAVFLSGLGAFTALIGGGINLGDEASLTNIVIFLDGLGRLVLIGLHQGPVMSIFAWPLSFLERIGRS